MRNRWYLTDIGRFVSEDPRALAGFAPAPQSRFVCQCRDLYAQLTKLGTGEEAQSRESARLDGRSGIDVGKLGGTIALPDYPQTFKRADAKDVQAELSSWRSYIAPIANADVESLGAPGPGPRAAGCGDVNGYSLAANDPVNGVDPPGLGEFGACFDLALVTLVACVDFAGGDYLTCTRIAWDVFRFCFGAPFI
jgi:hypothetical protein